VELLSATSSILVEWQQCERPKKANSRSKTVAAVSILVILNNCTAHAIIGHKLHKSIAAQVFHAVAKLLQTV
jgi:hypothetical protein